MSPTPSFRRKLCGFAAAALVSSIGGAAFAAPVPASEQIDRLEPAPARLRGVDLREHLNGAIPKQASFTDDQGHLVKLGELLDGKHPVILTLNYSRCPMLCGLELNGLVAALKQLDWTAGKEFRIATIVLDPHETPEQARLTKERYVRQYDRKGAEAGWSFLTGSDAAVHQVADSVGFTYAFNEKRNEYIHPAAIAILSPDGHIARYLYGLEYHPKTMRLSLVEASQGKIGSSVDQLVLYCFHYDATDGAYAPIAMNIMRVSSGAGAVLLGGVLTTFWIAEFRKKRKSSTPSSEGSRSS